jgi:hypothetical protein
MRNFDKVKALERLYSELSKVEYNPQFSSNGQSFAVTTTVFPQDITYILDVLSEAIHTERNK